MKKDIGTETSFSIIMPVYNGQDTVMRSINSVINQNYNNVELIVVDDGSTDDTKAVISAASQNSKFDIIYIYQENARQGAARNNGLRKSQGEYVLYLDADDEISGNLLLNLDKKIRNDNQDDVIFYGFERSDSSGKVLSTFPADSNISTSLNLDEGEKYFVPATPWAHVAKRSFLESNNISFLENAFFEDIDYMFNVVSLAKRSSTLDLIGYRYYIYEQSTVRGGKANRNLDVIISFQSIINRFKDTTIFTKHYKYIEYHAILYLLIDANIRVFTSKSSIVEKKLVFEEIKKFMETYFPEYKENELIKRLPLKKGVVYYLIIKNRFNTLNGIFKFVN